MPFLDRRERLLLVAALLLGGCRSNYAPRTPVTGVDRPYPEQELSEPGDAGPALLQAFMADLVAETELEAFDPSFAVFPAFSENRDVGPSINGMGVYLADQTTRMIEAGVVRALVFSGDRLQGELRRAGVPPEDLCTPDDIVQAASRLGVSYVVYGTVNHTTENALEGRQSVSVRWTCLRVEDGVLAALVDQDAIRGEAAAQFIGGMARPTSWNICRP